MISIKEAAEKAIIYFKSVPGYEGAKNVLIEEIEKSDDKSFWLITLSHLVPQTSPFEVITGKGYRKEFKVFKIDALTGEVVSMKLRNPVNND